MTKVIFVLFVFKDKTPGHGPRPSKAWPGEGCGPVSPAFPVDLPGAALYPRNRCTGRWPGGGAAPVEKGRPKDVSEGLRSTAASQVKWFFK